EDLAESPYDEHGRQRSSRDERGASQPPGRRGNEGKPGVVRRPVAERRTARGSYRKGGRPSRGGDCAPCSPCAECGVARSPRATTRSVAMHGAIGLPSAETIVMLAIAPPAISKV